MAILKQEDNGISIPELCLEHGMSDTSFYKWRIKYGGMDASLLTRMKELEDENRRLKKMYAEKRLKAKVIQEAMAKKRQGFRAQTNGARSRDKQRDEHWHAVLHIYNLYTNVSFNVEAY